VNILIPVLGAIVGMGSASALVIDAIVSNLTESHPVRVASTAVAAIMGTSILFIQREMILHWQLFAPPVVGGYLAAIASVAWFGNGQDSALLLSVWSAASLISIALHIRRRRVVSWLEKKQALAVHSKESQIVKVMRSADPKMDVNDFEALREKLLTAVDGDREQVDRIVFGGGLY